MENPNPLETKYASLKESLSASPTAQSGKQAPTISDIRTQQELLKTAGAIQAQQDAALKEQWYGQKDNLKFDAQADSPGLFNRTIDGIMMPLYGMVGAVDYAPGQSRSNSLGSAINLNMQEDKRMFGDVLRPHLGPAAAPVGLGLDIMMDPLTWATLGTAAMIPRVAKGTYKGAAKAGLSGAVKGAASAAESRSLESLLTFRSFSKGAAGAAAKTGSFLDPRRLLSKDRSILPSPAIADEKTSAFMKYLEERSIAATKAYDDIVGETAVQRLVGGQDKVVSAWKSGLQNLTDKAIKKSPTLVNYFNKYFKYSNADWTRVSRLRDALLKTSGDDMDNIVRQVVKAYDNGARPEVGMLKGDICDVRSDY